MAKRPLGVSMPVPVFVDPEGDVSIVRMDDGKVNAMNPPFLDALTGALERAIRPGDPVVLTGNGRVFSAGLDLRLVPTLDRAGLVGLMVRLHRLFGTVLRAPVPVVAAVNGAAVAGGAVLALCCDHRVGAEKAEIGATENAVGIPFPPKLVPVLEHRLSPSTVSRTVMLARRQSGEAAVAAGWLDRLAKEPVRTATEIARELKGPNPEAFRRLKSGLNAPLLAGWPESDRDFAPRTPMGEYVDAFFAPGAMERIREGIWRSLEK